MYNATLDLIRRALEEDGAEADITTLSTVPPGQQAQGVIIARQEGVIGSRARGAADRVINRQIALQTAGAGEHKFAAVHPVLENFRR